MNLKQFDGIGSIPSSIVELNHQLLLNKDVRLWMKREDLIHPIISGNKWRKLKYHLIEANRLSATRIVSMGGAFSNHLHALAFAGSKLDIPTHALIHGYNIDWDNPSLADCKNWAMTFKVIDKTEFYKYQNQPHLYCGFQGDYFVPLGGTDKLGIIGVIEMANEINRMDEIMDIIAVPFGSGGTIAGLITGLNKKLSVIGFSSFNGKWEEDLVRTLLPKTDNTLCEWEITNKYKIKGFAKYNDELLQFLNWFETEFNITLDHVYNGKMMYGLWDMIKCDKFKVGSSIMAIHTGGTQGRRGLSK